MVSLALPRKRQTSADAARAQVRIMIATESPAFAWNGFKLEPVGPGIAMTGISPNIDYRPVAIVKNVGEIPADFTGILH